MRTDLFDFELPTASIALRPAQPRDAARMLVVQPGAEPQDRVITDLPSDKQRMLERLNSSDEDLVGQTALLTKDGRTIYSARMASKPNWPSAPSKRRSTRRPTNRR